MNKTFNVETRLPYFILISVFLISIYPFLYMISNSLMTAGEAANQYLFPKKLMFENYVEVWTSNRFQRYTLNSLLISSITVIGVLTTSIPAAYSFARIDFPFKNIIFYSLLLSLMIPEIITLLPHLLIIRGEIIPLPFGPSWMNTLQGLTVPFIGNIFVIFLLRQYFKKIPNELWDAARMDGSTHFYFLVKVVIPMSKPIIVTVALFTFILSWNAFAWPLLILTRDDWYPVTVSIYSFVREVGPNFNLLMAACLISYISNIGIIFLYSKVIFRKHIKFWFKTIDIPNIFVTMVVIYI